MKRPNPLLHMLRWGGCSGLILAVLYLVFIFSLGTYGLWETFTMFFNGYVWLYAVILGGIPGAALGFLMGLFLWAMSRNFPMPFSKAAMQEKRIPVYAAIGSVTTVGGFLILLIFLGSSLSYFFPFWLFPPFIAGIASAYAAHRYLFRLRLWSEAQYGGQKAKYKNSERLEDKDKVDVVSPVEADESEKYEAS